MNKGGAQLLAKMVTKTDDPQTLRMVAGALANLCGNGKHEIKIFGSDDFKYQTFLNISLHQCMFHCIAYAKAKIFEEPLCWDAKYVSNSIYRCGLHKQRSFLSC